MTAPLTPPRPCDDNELQQGLYEAIASARTSDGRRIEDLVGDEVSLRNIVLQITEGSDVLDKLLERHRRAAERVTGSDEERAMRACPYVGFDDTRARIIAELASVRADEREQCAKIMDARAEFWREGKKRLMPEDTSPVLVDAHDRYRNYIANAESDAAAIRRREGA